MCNTPTGSLVIRTNDTGSDLSSLAPAPAAATDGNAERDGAAPSNSDAVPGGGSGT
ncbi:MAG: hypothetical protein ACJA07_004565 [Rhodococcus sp. (in: high G+C Gram-positive bacteria)]